MEQELDITDKKSVSWKKKQKGKSDWSIDKVLESTVWRMDRIRDDIDEKF